jgi:hypothetical protein
MSRSPQVDEVAEPEGEQAASEILATVIAPRIDALTERQHDPDFHVAPGSAMDRDDHLLRPYQLSHVAWSGISHALDNLRAFRVLTVLGDAPNLHVQTYPFAAYPLLRAALENAAQVLWLVGPKSRDERLTHRIRLLLADGSSADKIAQLTGHGPGHARRLRQEKLRDLIESRPLDHGCVNEAVRNVEVVQSAAKFVGLTCAQTELTWRLLSGLTHADQWASEVAHDREEVGVSADGRSVTFRATSPISGVTERTDQVVSIVEASLREFDARRRAPFG